jgi:hypothetical protein
VVYQPLTATLTLSDLAVGDTIRLSAPFPYFYPASQPSCTQAVAACLAGGILKVQAVGNAGGALTQLSFSLLNQAFVGNYSLGVSVYDSSNLFGKQEGTVGLVAATPGALVVAGTQTSPYLLEQSVYDLVVTFGTPNATGLQITLGSEFTYLSASCTLNCGVVSMVGGQVIVPVSSTWVEFRLTVRNPSVFNSSLQQVGLLTFNSQGSIDRGSYTPQYACPLPCRSCDSTAPFACLSCYGWKTQSVLFNSSCLSACPSAYFNSSGTCASCSAHCQSCTSGSGCSACTGGMVLWGGSCLSACPSQTYLETASGSCQACAAPCAGCSLGATNCTSCLSSFGGVAWYYLSSACYSTCPASYYSSSLNNSCLPCNSSCATCSASQCLTCPGGFLLFGSSCFSTCPAASYPADSSHCAGCPSACTACASPALCSSCLPSYSLFTTNTSAASCLSVCPAGWYSDGSLCQSCPSGPAQCLICSYGNQQPICSSCQGEAYIQEYLCVSTCAAPMMASGQYCLSGDCSQLSGCLVCSGLRCVQCSGLYSLTGAFSCAQTTSLTSAVASLSEIPVPFPFLIATLMLMLLAFFLRYNYPKMFSPLFLYALAGPLEAGCLVLWAVLAQLWNAARTYPLPLGSVAWAPVAILVGYGLLNVAQWLSWKCVVSQDRKYRLWEKQDNKCASASLAGLSLLLSFRLDSLVFSRTAHSQRLSARVSSPEVFRPYSALAIAGMLMNGCCIVAAGYLSYLQTSLTYLFFSCLEVAILSVIMLVLAVAMLCVPKEQLLEDKKEYTYGHDQGDEGPSLQEVLQVVEEHHSQHELHSDSGQTVMARDRGSQSDEATSQDIGLLLAPSKLKI